MDPRIPSRSLPEPARGPWSLVHLTLALGIAAAAPPAAAQQSQAMRPDCRTAQRDTPGQPAAGGAVGAGQAEGVSPLTRAGPPDADG
jgi:hypothetical protein